MTSRQANNESPQEDRIRVLVADDHPIFREGLVTVLRARGFLVVGEAGSGQEVLAQARAVKPDVILIDLNMPGMDGLQATRAIKAASPQTSVLMFTILEDIRYLRMALGAGASGYLLKESPPEQLAQAIRLVRSGGSVIPEAMMRECLQAMMPEAPSRSPVDQLSPMEKEVLRCLTEGLTNPKIAARLHYSVGTIKNAVERIIEKLGVSDRTQAAVVAVQAGFGRD